MPRQTTVVSVFLASPSDVFTDRATVTRVIEQWNAIRGKDRDIVFEVVKWENSTSSSIGIDGQDVVNSQIADEYDVMIALFWTKIGAKTARSVSGSVEEYERALSRHKIGQAIDISVYFKMESPSLENLNPQQYQGVLDLKDRLKKDGVYYKEFMREQDMDFEINILLDRLARKFVGSQYNSKGISTIDIPSNDSNNELSDVEKILPEDLGYYDLLDGISEHSGAAGVFLDGVTKNLELISDTTTSNSRRIEELKSLGPISSEDMRPIIESITQSFDKMSEYIEDGIENYALHSAGIAKDTINFINVAGDFHPSPEDTSQAKQILENFINSMSEAADGLEGFISFIISLQRMTVKFNQSRRRLVLNNQKIVELIKSSRAILVEAVEALS